MVKRQSTTGPNLTNVTYIGRLTVKYGLVVLLVLMVGRFALSSFINFWHAINPPPPPPPTANFGLLPPIEFPTQLSADKPKEYRLETKTGQLPTFGDRAKVFLMPKPATSLLDDEQSKAVASIFGFVFEPEVIDSRTYRFVKTQPLNSIFQIDIQDKNFSLKSNFLTRPELVIASDLPEISQAVSRVKSQLSSANLMTSDIATASGEVVYLKASGNNLVPALSLSDGQFVRVDIFRDPIDGSLQAYTPTAGQGTVSAIMTGNLGGNDSIVEMWYQHHPIDYSHSETYPLRSVQSAWEILKAGEGYVAGGHDLDVAVIRHVYLGYFDSFQPQDYFQPIYVFEGDDNFWGYVSAIDPIYIQNTSQGDSQ